jgi:hypothetical protein
MLSQLLSAKQMAAMQKRLWYSDLLGSRKGPYSDRQMEALGRTKLEEKLELRRSSNITSSDELRAEKGGSVGLSGSEKYNPATGRRTRLSF